MYPNTRQVYPNIWNNNRVRPVSSIEEVKAAQIDFDGTVFYFPSMAENRIYTKHINMDGTSSINMYEEKEIPIKEQPIMIDNKNFITREEFNNTITELKNLLDKTKSAAAPAQPEQQPRNFNF